MSVLVEGLGVFRVSERTATWRRIFSAMTLVVLACGAPLFARAANVTAVPLSFTFAHTKCGAGLDFKCFEAEGYLITDDPAEIAKLTSSSSPVWGVTADQALVFPKQAKGLLPLFRFYNVKTNDHFYTTDAFEGAEAVKWLGYIPEGVCCFVALSQMPGTVPLFRYVAGNLHEYRLASPGAQTKGETPEGIAGFVWSPVAPAPTLPPASAPPSPPTAPKGKVAAVALFEISKQHGNHALITDNADEAYELRNIYKLGWAGENPTFAVFPQAAVGTVALLRFDNPKTQDHFFTSDPAEGANAVAKLKYVSEGVCCFVSPTQVAGTTPLFRLLKGNQHLFVAGVADEEAALGRGYKLEGTAGWVWTLPAPFQPLVVLPAQ